MSSINARIDKINCFAVIVDEITLRGATARIGSLPRPVTLWIRVSLRTFDFLGCTQLGLVRRAQLGREIARDFVNDFARVVHQIFPRFESGNDRVHGAFFVFQNAIMPRRIGLQLLVECGKIDCFHVRRRCGLNFLERRRRHIDRVGIIQDQENWSECDGGSE